jgi:hypothetical protein
LVKDFQINTWIVFLGFRWNEKCLNWVERKLWGHFERFQGDPEIYGDSWRQGHWLLYEKGREKEKKERQKKGTELFWGKGNQKKSRGRKKDNMCGEIKRDRQRGRYAGREKHKEERRRGDKERGKWKKERETLREIGGGENEKEIKWVIWVIKREREKEKDTGWKEEREGERERGR